MVIQTEKDIVNLVKNDPSMMRILEIAKTLNLPDWWICAGFVRSKVWDTLHEYPKRTDLPDIDVVYYDPFNIDEQFEKQMESTLKNIAPEEPWSVKNQARMHILNGESPYRSTIDAVARFPETSTSIALKLNNENELMIACPWGIEDLITLKIKPTPFFIEKESLAAIYESRLEKKKWNQKWPRVRVYGINGELLNGKESWKSFS
ncbi:nucleotidyltransferase family protein [Rossellomorea aquimaris]|uniref:nucleotidyltransferase family protein n=1 Tax=Rossellomorea TaxID=2837508 RepID=UPI001CD34015|nr:nucleotidyltransferase family protein [Rossellomorea aquimaris]MCA1058779.1 nucleotidyltransferase family protein [Rossellomorea aquimaris]